MIQTYCKNSFNVKIPLVNTPHKCIYDSVGIMFIVQSKSPGEILDYVVNESIFSTPCVRFGTFIVCQEQTKFPVYSRKKGRNCIEKIG